MGSQIDDHKVISAARQDVQIAKQVIETLEKAVEDKIDELDTMGIAEVEQLRKKRVERMKQEIAKNKELLSKGHGTYEDIEEKHFFKVSQDAEKVIALFYVRNSPLCDIFQMHLKELASTHIESRFVSLNAEKSPFLVSRLNINSFPTIIVIVNGVTEDKIVGTKELGEKEDFPRDAMEWRLSVRGGIKYEGEFDPKILFKKRRTQINKVPKKSIREDSSESDD